MALRQHKKGYFFIMDAIIALFVLVLGLLIALSFFTHESMDDQVTFFSLNIMEFLSEHKLKSLNNDFAGTNGYLHTNGNITNLENSILEQIGEFYYRNQTKGCSFCLNLSSELIKNVTNELVTQRYNYYVIIEDMIILNMTRNVSIFNKDTIMPNESMILIPTKKIIHGIYNDTELWGPYSVEVWSWR